MCETIAKSPQSIPLSGTPATFVFHDDWRRNAMLAAHILAKSAVYTGFYAELFQGRNGMKMTRGTHLARVWEFH